jgi:hypothetical protein
MKLQNYPQLSLVLEDTKPKFKPKTNKRLAVLHFGMGFDSTALLFDYLENPDNWNFEIACILIAQTGNESNLIRIQVEELVFPRIREHQIRTVQIGRKSSTQKDGYVVLDDTTSPTTCYYRPTKEKPYFTLYDDLLLAATVPQFARNRRKCSDKFKGKILDRWHSQNCPGCLKLICYNEDEMSRFEKRQEDDKKQQELHPVVCPLIEKKWTRKKKKKWTRQAVEERVRRVIKGKPFNRSACLVCPFQFVAGSREEVKAKYDADPQDAALTAYLEFVSVSFNPRQTLSSTEKTLSEREMLSPEILTLLEQELATATWKVFDVRRIRTLVIPYRSIKTVYVGSREEALNHLTELALKHKTKLSYCKHGIGRVHRPTAAGCERFYVAAPGNPLDKERPGFAKQWHKITSEQTTQVELL